MRCNIINPLFLTDQHLIAERRELRMIPPLFEKRLKKLGLTKTISNIPEEYCLGAGHMLFWMNKCGYLENRYDLLTREMVNRGFKPDFSLKFEMSYEMRIASLDWEPSDRDIQIIYARLREKIAKKPNWYKYYGGPLRESLVENIYRQIYFN